ncbi:DUF1592 domain-containing protein [Schlesneria paludicola]|uniref:DUF1592 domain-containing protein n=1 Tax=Schlesneria paludicola TaxID=360056 RepID=UPI00138AD967|nr:DUF1592 domain-containing protein [Schlesneria paludicola]
MAVRIVGRTTHPRIALLVTRAVGLLLATTIPCGWAAEGPGVDDSKIEQALFEQSVRPVLQKYCHRCHNADDAQSGVRVDQLAAVPEDRHLSLLKGIQRQVEESSMPPEDEPALSVDERKTLVDWIERAIVSAYQRKQQKNGAVRRLTVSQYRNTLRDLLGIEEDLTKSLPPDPISKDGFVNNAQAMVLSPLQLEACFEIAEKALDLCIVDERVRPVVQTFRMELGASINSQPCPDNLILGANNALLNNADFLVTEQKPLKPFDYQPFAMRTAYEFIEGYAGNDTVRGWRKFDSIYHSVFACVRGTPGYPKGEPNQVVAEGLLLRPAIPSAEIFGQSDTYGPMANFKISLRELPNHGHFRVKVKAARYNDGLLLNAGEKTQTAHDSVAVPAAQLAGNALATITLERAGVYQLDVACTPGGAQGLLSVELGKQSFTGRLFEAKPPAAGTTGDAVNAEVSTAFLLVRLPAGPIELKVRFADQPRLRGLMFTRLADDSELTRRFETFERRSPSLSVFVGLRRDCGSTLAPVGAPQRVESNDLGEYLFEGAINNYPSPDVETDNVNYLAGIREIGVRSEFTDGRDMPRLLVRSVEFEGPFYKSWPPASHRQIFVDSPHREHADESYATDVIRTFATRAFRRPISQEELDALRDVWRRSFAESHDFRASMKDALFSVLTSPQFLFLIENSSGPESEDVDPYELASKLSYFLWNTAPDQRLLDLAAQNVLHESLDHEVTRMLSDSRFGNFVSEFASQWFSLDKFDVVAVDAKRYPRLTRDAKTQLRKEPVQFLRYLIDQNLSLRNLVQADFIVANEVVANYYALADRTESGFQFIPIKLDRPRLGGVLTQAGILSGLSDGRESNPIKRGAWLARKIIAEPPEDPPPNVPQIKEDDGTTLTLREKLERHRNQKGCAKCHAGIDPWGLPFESYDAGGLLKASVYEVSRSTLPDGTEINDLNALKVYLANDRMDQVAYSFLKHVTCYAIGRSLGYIEMQNLREEARAMKSSEYLTRDLIRFVVHSELFLKK